MMSHVTDDLDIPFTRHRPGLPAAQDRCQNFDLAFGTAHVSYSTAGDDCCTAALLLDVAPVGPEASKVRSPTQMGVFDMETG